MAEHAMEVEEMEKTEKDIKDVCKDESESVKSDKTDRYQEVAKEIAYVIKDDLFDSTGFDGEKIADVLRRRFDVGSEETGKLLMSEVTMLRVHSGDTFTVPMFGMLIFSTRGVMPIIPGISFPNYDIRNRYIGYTNDNMFHKVNWWTEYINYFKRDPSLILVSAIGLYMIIHTLLNWL